jgi:formate dehydrogenase subunit gamma
MTDDAIRSVVRRVSGEPGPLLLALKELQQEFGYVAPSAVPLVADELNVSRAEVHGVLTFYTDLRTTPPGQHHLQVCRAEACQARGADALVAHAQASLACGLGETTPDQAITLDDVFCLGNCALGPAVAVDGHMYGRVDPERFDALVREVRA